MIEMARPQPVEEFQYGGHYSPLLARLLRRRLPMLPENATITAWHRYVHTAPSPLVYLMAQVRTTGTRRYIYAGQPINRQIVQDRVMFAYMVDRLAREVSKHVHVLQENVLD